MKWELFRVGMRRAEWLGLAQGMIMDWTDECGLTLFAYYDKPNAEEIADISAEHRFEIAFKDIEGVGFFAIKFGDQPWGDCCFSPNLYPVRPRFEKPKKGQTYSLHVMLVDVSVGELKVLRTIALGTEFAEHFRLWCLKSLEKNIGQGYYNRVVDNAFAVYTTSKSIADAADVRWVHTHGEDEQRREEPERE